MTAGDDVAAPSEQAVEQATRKRLQRTTTMLAYRKEPLLVSQQHAAEAAVSAAATPRPSAAPKSGLPSVSEGEAEAVPTAEEAAVERDAANAWAVGGTCETRYWECPGKDTRAGLQADGR